MLLKDQMFLLHLGAPEGYDIPSSLMFTILSFRCTEVEKEHIILPVHLRGEGPSYSSGAPKWRRNILSFRYT
jgi:hypothetical protein